MEGEVASPSGEAGHAPSLQDLQDEEASLLGLLRVLLNPRTLPHVVLLGLLASVFFYYARSGQEAFSSMGYVSLSGGYLLTGLLSRFSSVKRWTQLTETTEREGMFVKRLFFSFRICLFPLAMSVLTWFVVDSLFGEDRLFGAGQDLLPVVLGFGFVLWAVIQGRSVGRWMASAAAAKLPETTQRTGGTRTSTAVIFSVLLVLSLSLVMVFDWALNLSDGGGSLGLKHVAFFAAFVAVFALAWKRTTSERDQASQVSDLHSFSVRWMLLSQALITWHMLTVWRHAVGENAALMMIEELALMAFTVVMAIWGLTSRSFKSSFKLVDETNALPVGLSFGYAYAGSVAMVTAVLETDVKMVMIIGHAIVILTLLWIQPKVLRGVLATHEQASTIQSIVNQVEVSTPPVVEDVPDESPEPIVEEEKEEPAAAHADDIGGDANWEAPEVLAESVDWDDEVELLD